MDKTDMSKSGKGNSSNKSSCMKNLKAAKLFILYMNILSRDVLVKRSLMGWDMPGDAKIGIDQNQFCCKFSCNCGYFVSQVIEV